MSPLKKKKSLNSKKDKANLKNDINNMHISSFDPIFGVPLDEAAKKSDSIYKAVPSPIRKSIEWLNKKGLKEEGLYRVPGSIDSFKQYQLSFDHGIDVNFIDEKYPENVAMVITKYIQELPEPIYTSQFESHFKIAFSIENVNEKLAVIRGILLKIPYPNRETIKIITDHLKLVVQHSDVNKMTSKNIGLTWCLSVGTTTGTLFQLLVESELGAPSTIVFNVPLRIAVNNSFGFDTCETINIPNVVDQTVNWLVEHDSYTSDLFIESGDQSFLETYKRKFNAGEVEKIPQHANSNDVASLLQLWLFELKDELIPDKNLNSFKKVSELNQKDQRKALREIFDDLPREHYSTLKKILGLFCRIISNSFLIDSLCLAAVISPSLRSSYSIAIKYARSLFDFDFNGDYNRNKSSSFGKLDGICMINNSNEISDGTSIPKSSRKKIRKNKSESESQSKVVTDSILKSDKKSSTKIKIEKQSKKNKKSMSND